MVSICGLSTVVSAGDLPLCAETGSKGQASGFRCVTRAGVEFQRYVNPSGAWGWKDLGDDGRIWYDEITANLAQRPAQKLCKKNRRTLPRQKDFQVAESHGFRELFNDMNGQIFWSRTYQTVKEGGLTYPTECFYFFDGNTGKINRPLS